MNDMLPSHLSFIFHSTRQSNDLHIIAHRTCIRPTSVRIHGLKVWNNIVVAITQLPSWVMFNKIKPSICHQTFQSWYTLLSVTRLLCYYLYVYIILYFYMILFCLLFVSHILNMLIKSQWVTTNYASLNVGSLWKK